MSQFTYEYENRNAKREIYEWDNVWWEQTERDDLPRVLYIGDSISCATRRIATALSEGKLLFDGFGTSKALDNPFLFDSIRMFGKQQKYRNAVLFNNGLHGFHLDDEKEYAYYYEQTVRFLIEEFKDSPVVIVLSTGVSDPEREKRVQLRNKVALNIAEKYGLSVIDLYSVSVNAPELLTNDGVHYQADGYKKFAEHILAHLKSININ